MSNETDSDDDNILLLTALIIKKKKTQRIPITVTNKKREEYEEYRLLKELESDDDERFFKLFGISKHCFEEVHEMLRLEIEKEYTNWRRTISSRERLAICLRYLATGDSHYVISSTFNVSRSSVSRVIKEVCNLICNSMLPKFIPIPNENIWEQAEVGFRENWNFPNCIGSVDLKQVAIKCLSNNTSENENNSSAVLLTIVDPYYKFLFVDIGDYGKQTDIGIFECSNFYRQHIYHENILPQPKHLPNIEEPVPHVLIGDEGFILQTYLMRPFPKASVLHDKGKKHFNFRLCHARGVVRKAFELLCEKWRIFMKPLDCDVATATDVIKAACCLHNYLISKENVFAITETGTSQLLGGAFRNIRPTNKRSPSEAMKIREQFVTYFEQTKNKTN